VSIAPIEATLELWTYSLRDVKARMRLLFGQARVVSSAGQFLDGLLGFGAMQDRVDAGSMQTSGVSSDLRTFSAHEDLGACVDGPLGSRAWGEF
jgi:hypothetical protein